MLLIRDRFDRRSVSGGNQLGVVGWAHKIIATVPYVISQSNITAIRHYQNVSTSEWIDELKEDYLEKQGLPFYHLVDFSGLSPLNKYSSI